MNKTNKQKIIQVLEWVSKCARLFYRIFIMPKSKNEDDARKEFILAIILFTISLFLIVLYLLDIYTYLIEKNHFIGIPPLVFLGIVIIFISMYVLSRKNLKVVPYLFITIYFSAITYGAFMWGADLPSVLLNYALIIFISSIIIDPSFGLSVSVLIVVSIFTIGHLQENNIIVPNLDWKDDLFSLDDRIEYGVTLAIMGVLSWLSNREIQYSLNRARDSEKELKDERDNLEKIVRKRTQEIKDLQSEKLAGIYKLIEFGRLSSGLFHDMMSPLMALCISVQKLEKVGVIKEKSLSVYLEHAQNTGKRIQAFIDATKRKIQNSDHLANFSLSIETEKVILLSQHRALQEKIMLVFKKPEADIFFYGNPIKFNQIITNLISNAIESCVDNKQKENIASSQNPSTEKYLGKVEIKISKNHGEAIEINVSDNGAGIKKDIIDKIFEPFFTTKDNLNSNYGGCGIGLASVKHIVEKDFRGKISAFNQETETYTGAIFKITIPIKSKNT